MKFSTTSHTLTATSGGATQALSAGCTQVSLFAEAAMDISVVPGTEGTLTAALGTAAATDVKEVRTVTTAGTFGVGDVVRVVVASNNVDFTVTDDDHRAVATGIQAAIAANGTVAALVDSSVSGNVVTIERKVANTAFTLTTAYVSRSINHHIGASERLQVEVPPGSTIRAKAASGTLNISEL